MTKIRRYMVTLLIIVCVMIVGCGPLPINTSTVSHPDEINRNDESNLYLKVGITGEDVVREARGEPAAQFVFSDNGVNLKALTYESEVKNLFPLTVSNDDDVVYESPKHYIMIVLTWEPVYGVYVYRNWGTFVVAWNDSDTATSAKAHSRALEIVNGKR